MVSAAMAAQGHNGGDLLPNNGKIFLELDTCADEGIQSKVRKPYTITKQRERWTEDEHKKFLEALKLYGRAWRKIEEHLGSKTAVQIRSHAQKFFSKVARDSNCGDADSSKPIDIPPPRPKRKPMHPYPHKLVCPVKTGISIPDKPTRSSSSSLSISEVENQSPTSVLSPVGSDTSVGPNSSPPNGSSSPRSGALFGSRDEYSMPDERVSLELELFPRRDSVAKDDDSTESAEHCLRLFGSTVLVSNHHAPPNTVSRTSKLESFERIEETCLPHLSGFPVPVQVHLSFSEYLWTAFSHRLPWSHYGTVMNSDLYYAQADPSCPVSLPWSKNCNGASVLNQEVCNPTPVQARLSCDTKEMPDKDEEMERSSTDSNTNLSCMAGGDFERNFQKQKSPSHKLSKQLSANNVNSGKGFVPYKRCLAKKTLTFAANKTAAEEPKNLQPRLCL